MLAGIEEFERTGDDTRCLHLLGLTEGRNPLLVLQDALKRAMNRRERDAFEDIALRRSRGESSSHAAAPEPDNLIRRARERYGDHSGRFLNVEQIRGLASGLWRLCQPPPTDDCLLAILGIEIENAVKDTVTVTPHNFGETLSMFRVNCGQCGGGKKGRGKIVCLNCLGRARVKLERGLATGELSLRGSDAPDFDFLAPIYLEQNVAQYGCGNCERRPIKPCVCAREVSVPASPRDGEVARGRQLASGQEHFFCLRVEGT